MKMASSADVDTRAPCFPAKRALAHMSRRLHYRGGNKGLHVLLSRTQAGPGRTVKQEQEEISRNHVQTFILFGPIRVGDGEERFRGKK